jgi:hypothetical protein
MNTLEQDILLFCKGHYTPTYSPFEGLQIVCSYHIMPNDKLIRAKDVLKVLVESFVSKGLILSQSYSKSQFILGLPLVLDDFDWGIEEKLVNALCTEIMLTPVKDSDRKYTFPIPWPENKDLILEWIGSS